MKKKNKGNKVIKNKLLKEVNLQIIFHFRVTMEFLNVLSMPQASGCCGTAGFTV